MIRSALFAFLLGMFSLFNAGCSQKNYFEPENIQGTVSYDGELPAKIVEVGYEAATLENGQVVTKEGVQPYRLPKGYRYIAQHGSLVAAAGDCKPSIVYNTETNETIPLQLPRRLLAALFIPGTETIAFLLEGNSYGIYDYAEKKIVSKYASDTAVTADIRIANPMMLEQLVLIPTLDGKLVIVNKTTGEKVREIIVGKGEEFNNVIFLDVIGNRLVAATPHRIISVSPKLMDAQSLEISDVIFVSDGIYILAKDGTIYHCDTDLKILNTLKFPFAHFVGAIYGEFIYVIEREGYVIATDPLLSTSNIFEIPDRIDDWLFTTEDALYYKQYYFKLHTGAQETSEEAAERPSPESAGGEEENATREAASEESVSEKEEITGEAKEERSWFSEVWDALKKMTEPDESDDTVEGAR
ncbi:hypothetical protein [Hydrogenimonas urashimensis]|uniref:hypothetical protein n=1 Tax=Hydrogenimonas urashimensis TaxID=2740515 RepID=UPI001916595D|nr:hypothetical protein [Hydrogenimonas urashimensis]